MFNWKHRKKIIVILCIVILVVGCMIGLMIKIILWENRSEMFGKNKKEASEYLNPICSIEENTWDDYGTGDPFVMRHNGKYYLYISTRDDQVGIKCFSSKDLVNWEYENLCGEENITQGAYAPEVVYYNGKFYMYTSPAGKGHYVLESESPTGPFKRITDNVGLSIDGSVFIDDDGKWYFYHAGNEGIIAHEMTSPKDMDVEMIDVNAKMNGWTEGPMVIKVNGKYYLTYTGNHVLSNGYRINYGVGDSPVAFKESKDNPLLIHTMDELYGIGHSSSVKGPDLDSYYIVYHSLVGRSAEGMPKRVMNIDRIVFNGEKMDVLGPTVSQQQMPNMPDIYSYFENKLSKDKWALKKAKIENGKLQISSGGYVYSKDVLGENFTIEYNLKSKEKKGNYGGYFHYIDKDNYGKFKLETGKQSIIVELMQKGEMQEKEFELNGSFGEPVDLSVNQTFQVTKSGMNYHIYMNDRLLGSFDFEMSGGGIGYYAQGCDATFGFIGGTGTSEGKSACTYKKPIPGTVQGVHFSECSDIMEKKCKYENAEAIVSQGESAFVDYIIRIADSGAYNFSMLYTAKQDASYALYVDEKPITAEKIPIFKTEKSSEYETTLLKKLVLEEGTHNLRICFYGADVEMSEFSLSKYEDIDWNGYDHDRNYYSDGNWEYRDGAIVMEDEENAVGKCLYGKDTWGDYTVKANLTFLSEAQDAGLLVRAGNPSLGGAGDDVTAGTCFVQGYYIALQQGKVVLEKLNYGEEVLAQADIDNRENHELQITVEGIKISVFVDGKECIVYEDKERPFLQGAVGVCTYMSPVKVENFEVVSQIE